MSRDLTHNSMGQQSDHMRLIVVLTITTEDGPEIYANACATIEEVCNIDRAEWKPEDGVAVFSGLASVPLSACIAALSSNVATCVRVRSIDYRETKPHGATYSK